MNPTSWINAPSNLLEWIIDLATRSTILLAIVLGAWRVLGRRRPLIGSAIVQAGLLGLLILPVASAIGPPLPIPLLEAPAARPSAMPEIVEGPPTILPPAPDDAALGPTRIASEGLPPVAREMSPSQPVASPIPTPEAPRPAIDPASILLGLYAIVALALLARLAASLAGVGRLRASSLPVDDPMWLSTLNRLRGRLGIARPVGLARSGRVGVPVVVGWLRPTILLPASSEGQSPEHAEAILLHELAHVRRGDYPWNVLLHLARALYWPHPMAWLLARAVAESRERACDAYCVHQMGGPAPYREALLATAAGLTRRPTPALGLAMARASRLARRIAEIDQGRPEPRCLLRAPARWAMAAFGLALAAALGPARITQAEPRPTPVVEAQEPAKAAEPARAPGSGRVFKLRVVDAATGRPVPRADVRVWLRLNGGDWRKADDEGRLDILHDTGPDDRELSVDAWGDGFAMQRHSWGEDSGVPIPDEATIRLQPGESLGGRVQDEEGRPVAGAIVLLWSHNYSRRDPAELLFDLRAVTGLDGRWHTGGAPRTTGEILGIAITHPDYLGDRDYFPARDKPTIADLRAGTAVSVMKKGVPIEGRVLGADGRPIAGALVMSTQQPDRLFTDVAPFLVKTDAEGRFRTGQADAGDWHLVVRAAGHAPAARRVRVAGAAIPFEEIRLDAPRSSFRARVVDPAGKPIEGTIVNIDSWRGYRCLGVFLYSDAEGWVRWDDAPEDELMISAGHSGFLGLSREKARAGSDLTFILPPSLSISGKVRDAETKEAIKRAEIEFGAVDPGTGEVASWQTQKEPRSTWVSDGQLWAHIAIEADAYKLRITGEGYEPFVSRAFRREEKAVFDYDVDLVPGRLAGPLATAIRPDGRPMAGARVIRGRLNKSNISLSDGAVNGETGGRQVLTAEDGTFPIPPGDEPSLVLILGDDAFAYASAKTLAGSPRLQARPFGRVEGRYLIGGRPLANWDIQLYGFLQNESTSHVSLNFEWKATTDAEGRFAFDKVIPMPDLRVTRLDRQGLRNRRENPGYYATIGEPVRVEDGRTTVTTIGGRGRPVVGRVDAPEGWTRSLDFTDRGIVSLETDRPYHPFPPALMSGKTSLAETGWDRWADAWRVTPEGRDYTEARVAIGVSLGPDGSFRFDDVPPGEYRVEIRVNDGGRFGGRSTERGPFAVLARTFTVPPIPGGRTDEPLDVGVLRLRARARPQVGEPSPRVRVATVDGRSLAIPEDFAGKFLLLDFGSMADDQSRLQIVRMNDVFDRFGRDGRFTQLSLLAAADRPESRAFVGEKGQPWPQAIVGPPSSPVADAFGVEPGEFPIALLIGPDGRIAARDLRYQGIGQAVAKALGLPEPKPRP